MSKQKASAVFLDTVKDYPMNHGRNIHTADPAKCVYNMMPVRVVADFYWLTEMQRSRRFLAVEASVTGEYDSEVLLYGLAYSDRSRTWMPAYRYLSELREHEYVLLPHYRHNDAGTVSDALRAIG